MSEGKTNPSKKHPAEKKNTLLRARLSKGFLDACKACKIRMDGASWGAQSCARIFSGCARPEIMSM